MHEKRLNMNYKNWNRIEKSCFQILRFFLLKMKTSLFNSYNGQYNNDLRCISEKLHQISP